MLNFALYLGAIPGPPLPRASGSGVWSGVKDGRKSTLVCRYVGPPAPLCTFSICHGVLDQQGALVFTADRGAVGLSHVSVPQFDKLTTVNRDHRPHSAIQPLHFGHQCCPRRQGRPPRTGRQPIPSAICPSPQGFLPSTASSYSPYPSSLPAPTLNPHSFW